MAAFVAKQMVGNKLNAVKGAVGGEGGDEDDKEKEEEAERERQEAIREAEERRKEKHRKMEEEREKMRQEIRDKKNEIVGSSCRHRPAERIAAPSNEEKGVCEKSSSSYVAKEKNANDSEDKSNRSGA